MINKRVKPFQQNQSNCCLEITYCQYKYFHQYVLYILKTKPKTILSKMQSNRTTQQQPRNLVRRDSFQNATASTHQLHHFDGQLMIKGRHMAPESLTIEYKDYSYPWDDKRKHIISKCICAFLNTQGGDILIGIQQGQQPKVKGFHYNERKIEQLKKDITTIVQDINVSAVVNQLVKIKLVPVIENQSNRKNYLYVIRITVQKGWLENCQKLYLFQGEYFFRTPNQVKSYNKAADLNEIRIWRIETMMEEKRKEIKRRDQLERLLASRRNNQPVRPQKREISVQTDLVQTPRIYQSSQKSQYIQGMIKQRAEGYESLIARREKKTERGFLNGIKRLWKKFTSICE